MRLTRVLFRFKDVAESTKKASNLPDRYIKRAMEQVEWTTPKGREYRRATVKRKRYAFTLNRPWTKEFVVDDNPPGVYNSNHYVIVEPKLDWSYFKGDRVEILVGEDKGKHGIINYIVEERNWVCVEGLNCEYITQGASKNFPGMMQKMEKPLIVDSEVMLVDPYDEKPSKIEWRYTEDGKRVRICLNSGKILPIPNAADETVDYKNRKTYVERSKDTKEEEVIKVTYQPALKTFAMDIAEKMGIQDDRVPAKSYWYYITP